MSEIPDLQIGHVGLYVTDLETMRDFYTGVLGFRVTDAGKGRAAEMAFLSRSAEEHHQIVLATGRPPGSYSVVNQLSFRVGSLAELRAVHRRLEASGVAEIRPIDHLVAWSVYFLDPEGNRLEVYVPTPWYVNQPYAEPLDLSKSDDELFAVCEAKAKASPGYMPIGDWKAAFAAR